jgi:pantothenate kinase
VNVLRSLADVTQVLRHAIPLDGRIVVAIIGPPGAGKSTIAAQLAENLGAGVTVLPMDGFHLPQARLVELDRRDRMGAPDTFDVPGFRATLISVRRGFGTSGHPVDAPGFDRDLEEPVPRAIRIGPEIRCVIVEGNYLLLDSDGWERTASMFDLSFFVELERETRLERLVARHEQFGKSPTEALAWALGPDEANAVLVETTAARADYRIALG